MRTNTVWSSRNVKYYQVAGARVPIGGSRLPWASWTSPFGGLKFIEVFKKNMNITSNRNPRRAGGSLGGGSLVPER